MSVELTDDQYLDLLLRGRGQKGAQSNAGGCFWTLFAIGLFVLMVILTADHFGLIPPALVDRVVGVSQTTFSTPLPTARPQQPPAQPIGGGAPPWPTLTPEPAAQEEPTATPAPTANPTAVAHLTAIAIRFAPTETAQTAEWKAIEGPYFYDPYTLATPEAGFGGYVVGQCADQEKVKKSFLLQQMCEGE